MIYDGHADSLTDLGDYVKRTVKDLTPKQKYFNTILVTGVSGIVVGAPVALELGVELSILRKKNDDSHHCEHSIGEIGPDSNILFLDDFIDTGETRKRIALHCDDFYATLIGHYMYEWREFKKYSKATQEIIRK